MVRSSRVLACVVAIGACAALAACGGDDDGGGAAAAPDAKSVRVAVIMPSFGNDFYIAQRDGIRAQITKEKGADVQLSAGRDQTASDEVIGLIENALARNVDAIAVNGSDDKPLLPVLRRVIAAKVPLVLFDASAPELEDEVAAYIGTDNRAGGEAGGKWLAEKQPQGGELGVILCVAGHPVTTARLEGFKAGLGDVPFKIVATADAKCDRDQGRRVMEDMLSAHPRLAAVFSTSDTQSLGAIAALKAGKANPAFVSFDAQPGVVKDILGDGIVDASVAWSAKTIGADAVRAAVAAARGEKVAPTTNVPVEVIDKSNAAGWKG